MSDRPRSSDSSRPGAAAARHPAVGRLLGHAGLAPRQHHKLLCVWPLVAGPAAGRSRAPRYVGLGEALASGQLAVEELAGASVPHVAVDNRGDVAVLVLFGEELRGALQNRIANASFLVPARSRVVIDVSCVEEGRWARREAGGFHASGEVLSTAVRRKVADQVRASSAAGHGFRSDQWEVWRDVGDRLAHAGADSHTFSYADYLATRETELGEATRAFRCVPGQVGFVAALGDEVVGLEAIGRPEVFAGAFEGLLRAYLVDAVDQALVAAKRAAPPAAPRFESPEALVAALVAAPAESTPSLGTGEDMRLHGGGVSGCALVAGDVVHLTAFPSEGA